MFLDTAFNSLQTVKSNISTAFTETAVKMWMYARCLGVGKRPGWRLVVGTIENLINLAFVLMKSKAKNKKNVGYKCALTRVQVEWLAINAFREVLGKRQSGYKDVIGWLDGRIKRLGGESGG
ncbi:hypothetical protein BKA61DRAFT_622131 [Leptodontidium sp. MPI-SDFR-AT-0119]|nr:hypothetical protein BKA61DRAFT_622131 [Leptodontidium sp. MPI-SDFR-AT-0119]